MELVTAASQGVFSIVVAAFLLWYLTQRSDRTEKELRQELTELRGRQSEQEKFIRGELYELCEKQGDLIAECTQTMRAFRERHAA